MDASKLSRSKRKLKKIMVLLIRIGKRPIILIIGNEPVISTFYKSSYGSCLFGYGPRVLSLSLVRPNCEF